MLVTQLYCIVFIHLYSASCSAHQSEALPVRETQPERREQSWENEKRHLAHQLIKCWAVTLPRPVLRTAAGLSGCIHKFGHVFSYMMDVLHWLPLQQTILYHIISLVWQSLLGLALAYLWDLCCTTMGILDRCSLRSTERGFLIVPLASQYQPLSRIVLS